LGADGRGLLGGGLAVPGAVAPELLVDGRVQVHGEDRRRRPVDGHRHRGGRVAQVEAVEEVAHVVEGGDRDPEVPILP